MCGQLLYPPFKIPTAIEQAVRAQNNTNMSPTRAARNPLDICTNPQRAQHDASVQYEIESLKI